MCTHDISKSRKNGFYVLLRQHLIVTKNKKLIVAFDPLSHHDKNASQLWDHIWGIVLYTFSIGSCILEIKL